MNPAERVGRTMLKFLVASDLHIVPDGRLANGIDTAERLRRLVDHVNRHHSDAEFCVFAGDLADEGEPLAYKRIGPELRRLTVRPVLTLGNHDKRPAFSEFFGACISAETGRADHVLDAAGHRVVVLDSLVHGTHVGFVSELQLSWLSARLVEAKGGPVIVVLHHNVADMNMVNDGIRLSNNDELFDVLGSCPGIRHVVSGHVHVSASGSYRGIPYTTIAGSHYNIAPRQPLDGLAVPRFEGPGQYGVVQSNKDSTWVLLEDFASKCPDMPEGAF